MEIQTALLRLSQGAMSNVVRHAHAQHATIRILRDDDYVHLQVTDDGIGMDPDASFGEGSFGLQAIRQRVDELAGEVSLTSKPGEGTIVNVILPIPRSQGEPS